MSKKATDAKVGIATVYARSDKSYVIGQVKFKDLSPSGFWDSNDFENEKFEATLMNHLVIGNSSAKKILEREGYATNDFRDLLKLEKISRESYQKLQQALEEYLHSNPKKIKSIAPLPDLKWPTEINLDKPSISLEMIGKNYKTSNTSNEMVEPMALLRLTTFLLSNWQICEEQRTSRKYLELTANEIQSYPESWVV